MAKVLLRILDGKYQVLSATVCRRLMPIVNHEKQGKEEGQHDF